MRKVLLSNTLVLRTIFLTVFNQNKDSKPANAFFHDKGKVRSAWFMHNDSKRNICMNFNCVQKGWYP